VPLDDRTCKHCGKKVEKGQGVFYVGFWYCGDCFDKLYGKKFGRR